MENIFQCIQPVGWLLLQIALIEPKEKKVGSFLDFKTMDIPWKNKKQFIRAICQPVRIDDLYPVTFQNKDHLKIGVLEFLGHIFRHHPVFDLIRQVQVTFLHS